MTKEQGSKRSHPLIFLLVLVALDSLGLGMVVPVIPDLMEELTGERGLGHAAAWGGVLVMLYAVMQFLFSPVMGNLADRFGRRPVLFFSLAAMGLNYMITGFAQTLAWLFLGRMLAGVFSATFSVANAYVADITEPAERGRFFGYLGAAWSLGFIIGPLLGGVLGEYSSRLPFFATAGLALVNVVYGFFMLPETLKMKDRRPFSWRRANLFAAFQQLRAYPLVFILLIALLFFQIAHDSLPNTWAYFTAYQLDWGPREIGYSLAVVGVLGVIVMAGVTPVAIQHLGERATAFLGFVFSILGFFGISTVATDWELYAWLLPWSLMGLVMPSLRALMSNSIPANAQGELQGAISGIMGLAAMGTPLFMTQLFRYFSQPDAIVYYPGASFLAASISMLCAFFIAIYALTRR